MNRPSYFSLAPHPNLQGFQRWIFILYVLNFFPSTMKAQYGFEGPYIILDMGECEFYLNYHFELDDFNGDGAIDLAANTRAEVGGGCGFCTGAVIPGGFCVVWFETLGASTVLISDLTNDGIPDMALGATNPNISEIRIIGGDGNGFFNGPTSSVDVGFPRSWWLRAADLNHDGRIDFIAVSESHTQASILLADEEGNFEPYVSLSQDYFGSPRLEDINNDNHEDLVYFNGNNLKIRLGTGNGTFQQAATYNAGFTGEFLRVADINDDNNQDIIISGGNQISVITGPGFSTYELYTVNEASDNSTGDFDGDGTTDIIVSTMDGVAILLGDANDPGSFFPANYFILDDPWDYWDEFGQIEVRELNGDALDDIIVYGSSSGNRNLVKYLSTTECTSFQFTGVTTNPSCFGDGNGSIDLIPPTNGNEPFVYVWSNGETSEDITGLIPGVYTVTVTDDLGCTFSGTYVIDDPAPMEVSILVTNVTCYGGSDGEASADASGGSSGYEFAWSNGETTPVITNLEGGLYTVTVTDSNGCSMSASTFVNSPSDPLEVAVSGEGLTCFGSNDGVASADASGGTPGYDYAWSNNETTPVITNLAAGSYTLTITDESGCSLEETVEITSPESLELANTGTQESCFGSEDGTAQVLVSGGIPGYSYLWSNGQTGTEILNLGAGIYTVTVTDQHNCTAVTMQEIISPSALEGEILTTNVSIYGGADGTALASINGGTIPYSYMWSNGQTTPSVEDLTAGIYSVTITDANTCNITYTFQINQPSCGIEVSVSVVPISCYGANDGSATAQFSGGTGDIEFIWNTGDITQTIDNLGVGVYSVTVSGEGCSEFSIAVLSDPPPINITIGIQPTICNDSTGLAYISGSGGTGQLNYFWSTGDNTDTIEQLSVGIYSVTVQDQNGCLATNQAAVGAIDSVPPAMLQDTAILYLDTIGIVSDYFLLEELFSDACSQINYTILDTVPLTCSTPPFDTLWVEVSDLSGNQAVYPVLVNVLDTLPPEITYCPQSITQGSCQGSVFFNLPEATDNCQMPVVEQTGGLPPGSIFPSGMTTVEYTVTDQAGQSVQCTFVVTIEEGVVLSATIDSVTCHGSDDGSIELDVSQITLPYTLIWSTGDTTTLISDIAAGPYVAILTDANGCVGADTFYVAEPEPIRLDSILIQQPTSSNSFDGSVSIEPTGGTSPYEYAWYLNGSLISKDQNLSNLGPGNYIIQITDAQGCVYLGIDILLSVMTSYSDLPGQGIEIYPNPAGSTLYVRFSKIPEPHSVIVLYDFTGRVCMQAELTGQDNSLSLEGLPNGVYITSILEGNKIMTRKFIVKS